MPEVGQIWKEKGTKAIKCYVTWINEDKDRIVALYPDGYTFTWTIEGFIHNHDFTGDHVPFEDVAAILF